MGRMSGKVVLITGAARGQGRTHALTFAKEGADVVAVDLCDQIAVVPYALATEDDLSETVAAVKELGGRCLGLKADARDGAQMRGVFDEAVAEFGQVDSVIINHGIAVPHSLDQDDTDAIFDALIETNLSSVWRTARAAIPHLRARKGAQGGGSITVTASVAALSVVSGLPGYVASKHGVIGLVKALASELAPEWIRVNAVCPGNVATPMLHNPFIQRMFAGGKEDATVDDMEFPLRAIHQLPTAYIEPEAISLAMVYLSSDEAKYVTGVALPVDAGATTQPPGITPLIGAALAAR